MPATLIICRQRIVNFFIEFVADFFDEQIGSLDVGFQRCAISLNLRQKRFEPI